MDERADLRRRLLLTCAAVACFALTYRSVGSNPVPGLDNSWKYAINHAFAEGLVPGRDVLFTFGPLGFLAQPMPLAANLPIATLFWAAVGAWLCGTLVLLAARRAGGGRDLPLRLLAVLALLSLVRIPLYQLFLGAAGSLLLFDADPRRRTPLLGAVLATTLALLIKIPYGALCLAALLAALALDAARRRTLGPVRVALVAAAAGYAGLWLLSTHGLAGSLRYLVAAAQFSTGSASAMSVDQPNDWRLLGAGLAALVAAPLCFRAAPRGPGAGSVAALVLAPLAVWFKYALAREDPAHYDFLLDFVLYAFGLLLVVVPGGLRLAGLAALGAVSIGAVAANGRHLGFPAPPLRPQLVGLRELYDGLLRLPARERRLEQQAPALLRSLELPASLRERIGDACVDVYPWQTLIVRANGLCWRMRPVFQSYIAYTPYLDAANAAFFRSDEGPDYVVWHGSPTAGVDGRYVLNDEPRALYQLLRHYAPVLRQDELVLFARRPEPRLEAPLSVGRSEAAWDEWIAVPKVEAPILRARLVVSRTLEGRLRRALYKEGESFVEYRFADGSVARHRLVIDNAGSGLWVEPYLTSVAADPLERVGEAALAADGVTAPPRFWVDRVQTGDGRLWVKGWAHRAGEDATDQRVFLVLWPAAGGGGLRARAATRSRRDVTQHFAASGLDLDASGFEVTADLAGVPEGTYEIALVVERRGRRAVARRAASVSIGPEAFGRANPVTHLRFTHLAGDFFVPELSLEWFAIEGEHPFVIRRE